MLLRNTSTGAFEAYYVSGNSITYAALVGTVGTNWLLPAPAISTAPAASPKCCCATVSSGSFELYQVAGGGVLSGSSVAAVGNNFTVEGFGNFSESAPPR